MTKFEEDILHKAYILVQRGLTNLDLFETADLLMKMELEKQEKDAISDAKLDYNDEIVSIEEVGLKETIDISVSGDNLFYVSDIYTKNSWGVPATADLMFALISNDELAAQNQVMIKQLKNRDNDLSYYNKFLVGVDKSKMRFYNLEDSAQGDLSNNSPTKKPNNENIHSPEDLLDNGDKFWEAADNSINFDDFN